MGYLGAVFELLDNQLWILQKINGTEWGFDLSLWKVRSLLLSLSLIIVILIVATKYRWISTFFSSLLLQCLGERGGMDSSNHLKCPLATLLKLIIMSQSPWRFFSSLFLVFFTDWFWILLSTHVWKENSIPLCWFFFDGTHDFASLHACPLLFCSLSYPSFGLEFFNHYMMDCIFLIWF